MQVNVHEAKTRLSRLLELVEQGEPVTIARHGKPVARTGPGAQFSLSSGSGTGGSACTSGGRVVAADDGPGGGRLD